MLQIRIRRICIISLDPDPYKKNWLDPDSDHTAAFCYVTHTVSIFVFVRGSSCRPDVSDR